MHELVIGLRS